MSTRKTINQLSVAVELIVQCYSVPAALRSKFSINASLLYLCLVSYLYVSVLYSSVQLAS